MYEIVHFINPTICFGVDSTTNSDKNQLKILYLFVTHKVHVPSTNSSINSNKIKTLIAQ